ncbi:MAG: hypothetical protein IT359_17415 [Gemmatimonadaceae bacterium]|nr:hypothetical protein [Gemmatimonadaceae bacterium]
MRHRIRCFLVLTLALALSPAHALAQPTASRTATPALNAAPRLLLIGTRPEDEDNALIAWASLGRHIETASLSLTRGEDTPNLAGLEHQAPLAVVRTAELLAERRRDGARQYFTRAYDFGATRLDSVVAREWPGDTLLREIVAIVRAFRPHAIVALTSSLDERDATRRLTARLAAAAFAESGDTVRWPTPRTGRLPAWTVGRLYTLLASGSADAAGGGAAQVVQVNVGEFDRAAGRSFAERGSDIRQLQRTLGAPRSAPMGPLTRTLRLDSTRVGGAPALFGAMDTTWSRFAGLPDEARIQLDSLRLEIHAVEALASGIAPTPADLDSLAARLARVAARTSAVRVELGCRDESGVPTCPGVTGDLAVVLATVRERATQGMLAAAGLAIDATVERALVAAGDSVLATVTLYNGGTSPITVERIAPFHGTSVTVLARGASRLLSPDSSMQLTGWVRVTTPAYHWWQVDGLQYGTSLHARRVRGRVIDIAPLIAGEDRIRTSGVEATIRLGGVEVPLIITPLSYRTETTPRGDADRPLAGVPPTSILLDRLTDYVRANTPIDRLVRVYVRSARASSDTLVVQLHPPAGLSADSTQRTVALAPFGSRTLFYRLRGTMRPGTDSVSVIAQSLVRRVRDLAPGVTSVDSNYPVRLGTVTREYPHIPAQQFVRFARNRLSAIELRLPPRLSVAYVRGASDLRLSLASLNLPLQLMEPALLTAIDLSSFSTVLIGDGALAGGAMSVAVPALQRFVESGGTLVVLGGGPDAARSALLPYPITFDSLPRRVRDTRRPVQITDPRARLLAWPNVITAADFTDWDGEYAHNVPAAFDGRYVTMLSIGDAGEDPTTGAILTARVGRGRVIFTALSLEAQVEAAVPGAARLLVNLLAAGLAP